MAQITLTYDARNPIAKKTIAYLLSLGIFKTEESNIPMLSNDEEVYLENLKKISPSIRDQALKKNDNRSLQSLIDEL